MIYPYWVIINPFIGVHIAMRMIGWMTMPHSLWKHDVKQLPTVSGHDMIYGDVWKRWMFPTKKKNRYTSNHSRQTGICHPIVVECEDVTNPRTINRIKQEQPGHTTQQESRCRQSKTVKLASKSKFSKVIHSSNPLANIKNGIRTFFLDRENRSLGPAAPHLR